MSDLQQEVSLQRLRKIVDSKWDLLTDAQTLSQIDAALDIIERAESFYFNAVRVLHRQKSVNE